MEKARRIVSVTKLSEIKTSATDYYIDVRNRQVALRHTHPDLIPYTTNGIMIYQEQVMAFLVDIAGYSLEESDQIRAAIAKKKHEVIMSSFERIRANTKIRGWTEDQADSICDQIQAFAKYSFNLSHSRGYSELGYITMYLKHYHKLEWWTAVLNNTDDEDKLRHYVSILGDMIRVPSIDISTNKFAIAGDKIIAPLTAIKQVGDAATLLIVEHGPYSSLKDFLNRVPKAKVNIQAISALIKGRALDCWFDKSLPYGEARIKFIDEFVALRKCKDVQPEVRDISPLSMFLMEQKVNKCFNKSILDDQDILNSISKLRPTFTLTGRKGVPMTDQKTPVISNLNVAKGLVVKEFDEMVGMVMLFQESHIQAGHSKRSGKPYSMLKVILSDGSQLIECVQWDQQKALGFPKNSIVYIRGKLSKGFRSDVSLTIDDIQKLV